MKKIAVAMIVLMVAACQTNTKKDASPSAQSDTRNTAAATAPSSQEKASANGLANQDQSVYFEYAKANVTPEYHKIVLNEANALKSSKAGITLEGNCDERGSAEYNLALGQRRADAVKKLLEAAGVSGKHIKTVSLGKEKPKAACHDESCWKQNRRVDFAQSS